MTCRLQEQNQRAAENVNNNEKKIKKNEKQQESKKQKRKEPEVAYGERERVNAECTPKAKTQKAFPQSLSSSSSSTRYISHCPFFPRRKKKPYLPIFIYIGTRSPIDEKQKRRRYNVPEPKKPRTFKVAKADDVEIVLQTVGEVFWSGSRWWW
jgi:hypothetical protein